MVLMVTGLIGRSVPSPHASGFGNCKLSRTFLHENFLSSLLLLFHAPNEHFQFAATTTIQRLRASTMFLPHITKLLPLVSLAVTVTAAPAPALAIVNAAVGDCESDYARCLRLRMDLEYCQQTVCNIYNNEVHMLSPSNGSNKTANKSSVQAMPGQRAPHHL